MELSRTRRAAATWLLMLALAVLAAACDGGAAANTAITADTDGTEAAAGADVTLNLGYFPNITHATAIVGDRSGLYTDALGDDVTLKTHFFNAGPEATEALFAEAIDATFIGPNPAINAHAQSGGEAIRIVSGATSGGAFLVVRPEITKPADLKGATIASPQLGGTQDVALRSWLKDQGFATDESGGGDVAVQPQSNGDTLSAFIAGDIDGAWVPEPWATRLIREGKGTVLVDEADLWPEGRYVTTHLIVRTEYLNEHPDVIKALLTGHVEATEFTNANTEQAQTFTREGIEEITGEKLDPETVAAAWKNLTFTVDPIASSLTASKDAAVDVGLLEDVDLAGIYALEPLNEVLAAAGQAQVSDS